MLSPGSALLVLTTSLGGTAWLWQSEDAQQSLFAATYGRLPMGLAEEAFSSVALGQLLDMLHISTDTMPEAPDAIAVPQEASAEVLGVPQEQEAPDVIAVPQEASADALGVHLPAAAASAQSCQPEHTGVQPKHRLREAVRRQRLAQEQAGFRAGSILNSVCNCSEQASEAMPPMSPDMLPLRSAPEAALLSEHVPSNFWWILCVVVLDWLIMAPFCGCAWQWRSQRRQQTPGNSEEHERNERLEQEQELQHQLEQQLEEKMAEGMAAQHHAEQLQKQLQEKMEEAQQQSQQLGQQMQETQGQLREMQQQLQETQQQLQEAQQEAEETHQQLQLQQASQHQQAPERQVEAEEASCGLEEEEGLAQRMTPVRVSTASTTPDREGEDPSGSEPRASETRARISVGSTFERDAEDSVAEAARLLEKPEVVNNWTLFEEPSDEFAYHRRRSAALSIFVQAFSTVQEAGRSMVSEFDRLHEEVSHLSGEAAYWQSLAEEAAQGGIQPGARQDADPGSLEAGSPSDAALAAYLPGAPMEANIPPLPQPATSSPPPEPWVEGKAALEEEPASPERATAGGA